MHASSHSRVWPIVLAVFLLVAASRLMWLSLFASDLPYWDQWDAEGWALYRPYLLGTLGWTDLAAAHNEHRIFWPRVTLLALFAANGNEWNNLVAATVSSLFFAAIVAVLAASAARTLPCRERFALGLLFLVAALLPIGWENLLSGFQIAFFWMMGFTVATLALACSARSMTGIVALLLVSCAGLLTLASAVITPVAAAFVVSIRLWQGDLRMRTGLLALVALGIAVAVGYGLLSGFAAHDGLKAQGPVEFVRALMAVLAWPFPDWRIAGWLLWSPSLLWLPSLIRREPVPRHVLLALALVLWVLMQCVAIAASRGHGLAIVPNRYVDLLMLAPLANAYLMLAWLARRRLTGRVVAWRYAAAVVLVLAISGLGTAGFNAIGDLGEHQALTGRQTANVKAYLASGDFSTLANKPFRHIPYPDASRLAMFLGDAHIREMLPTSLGATSTDAAQRGDGALTVVSTGALRSSGWFFAMLSMALMVILMARWLRGADPSPATCPNPLGRDGAISG